MRIADGGGAKGGSQGQMAARGSAGPFVRTLRGGFVGNTAVIMRPGYGIKWRFISAEFKLVCSADVADRRAFVQVIDEEDLVVYSLLGAPIQTASQTRTWGSGPVGPIVDTAGVMSSGVYSACQLLAVPFPLVDKMGLWLRVENGVAADVATFVVCVEEIRTAGNRS